MNDLAVEARLYDTNAAEWAKEHAGEFVLIRGDAASFHKTYEDALISGYEHFGLEPFLVKRVEVRPVARTVTRLMAPAAIR